MFHLTNQIMRKPVRCKKQTKNEEEYSKENPKNQQIYRQNMYS